MDRLLDHLTRPVFGQSNLSPDWHIVLFWAGLLAAFAVVSLALFGLLHLAAGVVGWNGLFLIIAALILFGGTLAGRDSRPPGVKQLRRIIVIEEGGIFRRPPA